MRKITIIASMLFSLVASAQDTLKIIRYIDTMEDSYYIAPNKSFIILDAKKTKGFRLDLGINKETLELRDLLLETINIGACNENNELIILFEDDTKIKLKSWNKFDCEGSTYFGISEEDAKQLATKKAIRLKYQNGYTFDSLTEDIEEFYQDYFIKCLRMLANNQIFDKKQ